MVDIRIPAEQLESVMPYEHLEDLIAHGIAERIDIPRLLFLDVDGVLNNTRWKNPALKEERTDERFFLNSFDTQCVRRLIQVLAELHDTKIVISSTWRKDPLLMKVLETKLGRFNKNIIGKTVSFRHGYRGLEIEDFLFTNFRNREITMCILDDDGDFFPHQKQFHVQTDMEYGVTDTIAYRVKQRLLYSKRTIS
ncbi:hypothetical protein EVB81_180 [Rhizobium phage RHph_I46]|uniref:Uncharacterized protein n=1 Tax=Rhizobium phage RHph_I1_9 TaxID=2509729 RepID=A0A7S5R9J4_9CAUD|nr:hypothetical protein PP936_gp179 [Rhizobium phage RHph_I1_9]QIG69749.1 hypothetical protein EVB81_180 [Rhizobium phage RHph_I46]QIG71030.1 hypothetical protein EVB92_180 [Rhizobium phage RHph_I9]QIG73616.1 hypothetical protein EVC04_179 [Rhizobium phage RHph_I1_9]